MKKSRLVRKIYMECPLCEKKHEIEERIRIAQTIIKGERVEYEENYYLCLNSDEEENEFITGSMSNSNLLNARNCYRKQHGLLTSSEIVNIREQYGLSQVDLSKILGWGEATISRYESKAIQDEAYDNILRIIRDDSVMTYAFLQKNKERFPLIKYLDIRQRVMDNLNAYGKEYLKRQLLESEYVEYTEPSDYNGYQKLNIDKLESVISYFASQISNLFKVKLMKMLWYADALMYKNAGKSITGLVYLHENMGALPIGHYRIVELENVKVDEEECYEYTKYHFMPNDNISTDCLSAEEISVLDRVISKFNEFDSKEIVKYMHDEKAYKETMRGEIIPFSLAKEIKEF